MGKIKSSMPNKLRVFDFLSILSVTRKRSPGEGFFGDEYEEYRFSAGRDIALLISHTKV